MANDFSGPTDTTMDKGVRVWIEPDVNAPAGCGRVMLSTGQLGPQTVVASAIPILSRVLGVLAPENPKIANNLAVSSGHAANDNKIWLGEAGGTGFFGSDVDAATLANGSTIVAWIGEDQVVHAKILTEEADQAALDTDKLNELLGDLGNAGQGSNAGPGRLKLVPLANNGFAALWIADFGLMAALVGKAFLTQISDAEARENTETTLNAVDLSPVVLPQGAKGLAVTAKPDGKLAVTVKTSASQGVGDEVTVKVATTDIDLALLAATGDDDAPVVELTQFPEDTAQSAPDTPQTTEVRQSSGSSLASGIDSGKAEVANVAASTATAAAEAKGSANVELPKDIKPLVDHATQPVVVVTAGGTPVVLDTKPGAVEGESILTAQFLDPNGQTTLEVVLTEHAKTADSDAPGTDLQPAATASGTGITAVWLEAGNAQTGAPPALKLQSLDGNGEAASSEPVTVAPVEGDVVSVSDFAVAYLGHRKADDVGTSGNDASTSESEGHGADGGDGYGLAVAWVQNADSSGYGLIVAQRFAVEEAGSDKSGEGDGQASILALGCDGQVGGDDDSAFSVGEDGAEGKGSIGRAPSITDAGDDAFVVSWVSQSPEDASREVVNGVVLNELTGAAVAVLDLSNLMSGGLVAGTSPSVLASENGDIIVAWLQASAAGGYDEAGAVYDRLPSGLWLTPSQIILLSHFDTIPQNLLVTLTDGDDPEIVVSWQEGSRTITGEHYSLDGLSTGEEFSYRLDKHDDVVDTGGSDGGLVSTLLPDGKLLVVYDGSSESGLTTAVVSPSETSSGVSCSDTDGNDALDASLQYVQIDTESDLILINVDALADNSGSGSNSGSSGSSGSGSSGSGSGSSGDYDDFSFDSSGNGDGSGSSGHGDDNYDGSLIFVAGYGNDVADYVEEDHLFDDLGVGSADPLADAFDALQFANALSDSGNMEVITFDASNIVVIRDFEVF